ncbi:DEAD/DEAH box helicase family protein [Weissella ceti]|uniref:DEAD/DEAH box helicase family protein n=1 Tax=Weissella ceti TaxID=759620 RepID=UPI001BCD8A45|nr:DEAD/DEAH box helicase family protein [Weissella ceti]QVK12222.1 DEAD/DEAH box helicase family protein [Weissella ceti]
MQPKIPSEMMVFFCVFFYNNRSINMENKTGYIQGRDVVTNKDIGGPAIQNKQCMRCYAKIEQWMRGPKYSYCWTCHQMGIITDQTRLIQTPENNDFKVAPNLLTWVGKLTPQQQRISEILCAERNENQLIHAVTGAGKTEMLYPLLQQSFLNRQRIAFVAPRVDVVKEIGQRLSTHFKVTQTIMTGETPDEEGHYQLVCATIHQLFKFKQAFDLIIVDECDAFPLYKNTWLKGALQKALKSEGRFVYLTATLPKALPREYGIKKQNILCLYKRFHGYPLPNLKIRLLHNWRKQIPSELMKILVSNEWPILIFVPTINDCLRLQKQIQGNLSKNIGIAYAGSSEKNENIAKFKAGELNILITTILLERGVTFSGIDVVILGAEEDAYTTSTLIQIAGRCGRTLERPTGNVYVYTTWKTRKIQAAYKEIARMNQ